MKKVNTLDMAMFRWPNPGLLAYFKHVESGNDIDIRPPFWNGKTREQVLSMWSDIFDTLDVDHLMPGLKAFELEMRGKVGPLSIMLPLKDRIASIEEYYKAIKLRSQPIDSKAIESVIQECRQIRVQRRDWNQTVRSMRLNTNSGAPFFTKRSYVKDWRSTDMSYPAVLGWRGQEGGPEPDDVKQRVVWMFPFTTNVAELSVYQPLIEQWQRFNINPAYLAMRAVEEKITRLFDSKGDEYVVVTDFSKFDQHFNSDLQDAARSIIASQLYDNSSWLETVFPVKYNIPLVCSMHLAYYGPHGMGSGSGGTNFDECCAHRAMQYEAAILKGAKLNPYSNAYGDDGYLSYKGIDVDDVISTYTSHGQEMNPDKQSVDKHSAVYLRRYFHDSYRDKYGCMLGVYSTFRALGRLLGQERYIPFEEGSKDYARYVVLRALSILENCANSPIFEKFVDFVISGDKYKLGLGLPGFFDSLNAQVKEFTDIDPGLLGYTKTLQHAGDGINEWKVVKYLRSKQ